MSSPVTFPSRHPSVRRWAGATAVVLATTLALAACGIGNDDPVPASGETNEPTRTPKPSQADASSPGTPTETPTESPAESPSEDGGTAVPVYFAGDGPRGTALFREFQRVDGDPLTEAAQIVGGGEPGDPDYRTLWPPIEISSVSATDGVLLVEVPSDGFTDRPDGMSKRHARLALQQLVYTLQGVQQERLPVVIDRPDTEARLFGIPTGRPVRAASPMQTLNLVNITAPAEGDTVTRDFVTVSGVANSFEASGPCRLLQDGEELTLAPYTLDGWAEDRLFPFQVDIPLDGVTGEVVVQCETDDPSGGAEGNGPAIDTKTITVQ
jgi:hypothetical protein